MQPHATSLRICHERIGERERDKHGRYGWCSLTAHGWCFDDSAYFCEIHLAANHQRHHVQLVTDEAAADAHPDRRSGADRRLK